MAKRFVDTEIWQKEWFGELPSKIKCLVFYILGNCDCAGIFEANYRNLEFYIGDKFTEKDILSIKQIVKLPNGKFFWTDFINFQYGANLEELNPKFSVHKGIIKILKKNGILQEDGIITDFETVNKELDNCSETVQYKDKDKDKDKDKVKVKDIKNKYGEFNNVLLTDKEYNNLQELYKTRLSEGIEKLSSYIEGSGKRYKSHYAVLGKHNWVYQSIMAGTGAGRNTSATSSMSKSEILREAGKTF